MNEPIILKNDGQPIHKLIHLSDIHIRTGDPEKARYKEYQSVFEHLIKELKEKDLSNTAFVITGDIFHHKGKIEPAGIKLTNYLFNQLLKLAPVVVICGNHDYRQDDPEIPDMIESLLETYQKRKPFYYLNKTGAYVLNNITFGVVDIRDTLKSYNTSGRIQNYTNFPKCDSIPNVDYKVALFHGWVKNKDTQDDKFQYYPLNWFEGYPYILLGDVHKHQIHHHQQQTWGYPGSMIQQDFGETITGHGYIEWNLSTGNATHHNIYNPYGYCTLKKHNNDWYVHHHKKEWYPLKEICENEFFPKQPTIRVKHTETDDIHDILKKYNIQPSKVIKTVLDVQEIEDIIVRENVTTHLEELNTPQKWIDYLQYHTKKDYSSYILNPETLKLPKECEELKKYSERNTKIQKSLDEYYSKQNANNECLGERVELVHMSWNYLMCYGDQNYLEFTHLKNQIALLNGKNAIGKSSFLDILCIGLYGEPTKMRHMISGKKYTGKIIHDHRPGNKNAPSVSILLKIKGQYYEIHRVFGIQSGIAKENHQIVQTLVTVSKVELPSENPSKHIICEGNAKVEEWIEKHIGNMESVLMSTMMCQTDLSNFFHLKQDDQKMILDTALHLENVSFYGKVLRESLLGHQDVLNQLKTSTETISKLIHSQTYDISAIDKQMAITKDTVDKYNKFREEWLIKIRRKNWKNITVPDDIQERYREVKDIYDYHFKKEQYEALQSKSEHMIRLEEKLKQCTSMLQLYEDYPIIKDADSKLQRWQEKYDAFLKKKPKCEVSIEWIESTKAKYEQWKQQQPEEWLSDTFQQTQTFEKDMKELWDKAVSKPTKKRPHTSQTTDIPKQIVEQYHALIEQSQQKPSETKEDYQKWKHKYDKWYEMNKEFMKWNNDEDVKEKLNKIQQKLQQIDKTETELTTIEKDIQQIEKEREFYKDLKFNPKCHECQTNPFNKKKQDIDTEYTQLKPYSIQLLQHIEKLKENSKKYKYHEKEKQYTQQLQQYQKYSLEKDYYEAENDKWQNIIKQLNEYEEWSQQLETIETQYNIYQWKLYDEWDKAYTTAVKQYQQWEAFTKENGEWTKTLETLVEQEAQWELFNTWQEEESIVKEKLEMYERSVQKKKHQTEYNTLQEQFQNIQKDVDNWKKLKAFKEDYEQCEELYAIYKLHELEPILDEAKEEMEKVRNEYIHALTMSDQQKAYKEQYQYYNALIEMIQDRCEQIRELETYFIGDKTNNDGYKEWIYKDKVIPLLNQEMNQFLTQFEDFRFKMMYDKRQFIYMLQDRGNEPTLDKASGYQNLIVSLAFRLALTRIGAIGQQFKHLFIDEGFTACDTNNIEKVPILLKNIMDYGKYHSIILMSHLDSVRECSQVRIQIDRQDPYSYIHHGTPYPKIQQVVMNNGTIIEKKTRGRKPKQ